MTVTVGEDTWHWDDPWLPMDQQFALYGETLMVAAECFDDPCPIEYVQFNVNGIGEKDSTRFVGGTLRHRGVYYSSRGRPTGFFNVTRLDTTKQFIEADFEVTLFANNGQKVLMTGSVAASYRGG